MHIKSSKTMKHNLKKVYYYFIHKDVEIQDEVDVYDVTGHYSDNINA